MNAYSANHPPPTPAPATGQLMAGAARSWVPGSTKPRPLIGYGPLTPRDTKFADDTFRIRALMLDDGAGGRCVLITADLWAASSLVLELAAEILLTEFPDTHLGRDQLFFSGTHTHCSPGGCYESPYYSRLAEGWPFGAGFNYAFTQSVARAVATTASRACANARPATIEFVNGSLSGWTINRSFEAHLKNVGAPTVNPNDEGEQRKAVETTIPLIVARDVSDRGLIGVFGTVSCHGTTLGMNVTYPDADFLGFAAHELEKEYDRRPTTDSQVVFALCSGVIGDADPQPPNVDRATYVNERKKPGVAAQRKYELATALMQAVRTAIELPSTPRPAAVFEALQAAVSVPGVSIGGRTMPSTPLVGAPVMAGSELGRGPEFFAPEGTRSSDPDDGDAHWPKKLNHVASLLANGFFKNPDGSTHSPYLNLSVIKLGVAWLVGLPGEPTTQLARDLTAALQAARPGAPPIVICGVNGGYNGYFVTEAEYRAQHYEGASCIWGRHTGQFLADCLLELLAGGGPHVTLRRDGTVPVLFRYAEEAANTTPASRARDAGYFMLKRRDSLPPVLHVDGVHYRPVVARPSSGSATAEYLFLLPLHLLGRAATFGDPAPLPSPLRTIDRTLVPEPVDNSFTLTEDATLTW